jgi:hypothetical protein
MFAVAQVQGSSRTVITSRIHLLVKTFLMYLDMSFTYHDVFLMYVECVPLLHPLNLLHSVPSSPAHCGVASISMHIIYELHTYSKAPCLACCATTAEQ